MGKTAVTEPNAHDWLNVCERRIIRSLPFERDPKRRKTKHEILADIAHARSLIAMKAQASDALAVLTMRGIYARITDLNNEALIAAAAAYAARRGS